MKKRRGSFYLFVFCLLFPHSLTFSQILSYKVINYKLNLDIYNCFLNPYPSSFNASETITVRTVDKCSDITFNAEKNSIEIISVTNEEGNPLGFYQMQGLVNISLGRQCDAGETLGFNIEYKHKDVVDSAFYCSNGIVYTDSEPEGARRWFPCLDQPNRKATFDITARVPLDVMLGSNGVLADSVITSDTITYHWISREPLATYLAVIVGAVNNKQDIIYCKKLSDPGDSLPLRFYYAQDENPQDMEDLICDLTNFYSEKFGEQPYGKNGFASVSKDYNSEGMENQTLTIICGGCWRQSLIAHEYAHQWFGDLITCGSWADLWINEGFATYCEALYDEHRSGYAKYKAGIDKDASEYFILNPHLPAFNPAWREHLPGSDTLFDNAITYNKGACILHMLRYVLGDTLFFNVLKSYAGDEKYRFGNVYTEDFITSFSGYAGQDLNWFFREWVTTPDHPVYENSYKITKSGNEKWKVVFTANQKITNTPFHKMPIVIKVTFEDKKDTTVKVMNDVNNQKFEFKFAKKPVTVSFDPNNDIVLKEATIRESAN